MLKVMSKMGISTYQSYSGAQIFDAVGLSSNLVDRYFCGTSSKVEGIDLEEIQIETENRHELAFGDSPILSNDLDVGGDLSFRIRVKNMFGLLKLLECFNIQLEVLIMILSKNTLRKLMITP